MRGVSNLVVGSIALPLLLACALVRAQEPSVPPKLEMPAQMAARSGHSSAQVAARTAVIIHEFSVNEKSGWPYDLEQLRWQTAVELREMSRNRVDVLLDLPVTPRVHTYTLNGEILSYRRPSFAKLMTIGIFSYGALGMQSAVDIHYWLTDAQGKKVFERKETIREKHYSDGDLVQPCARKVANRLTKAKLF